MIESFFQSLRREGVAYLLISGQATVLYGAATFSEDIDLWIDPTPANCTSLLSALRSLQAAYYKLTPPLQEECLKRGHGFHFAIPDDDEEAVYLDVIGQPPRVNGFAAAAAAARLMATDWGEIPTASIRDLVALKRTQRLADYPIISRLVLCFLQELSSVTEEDALWALANLYTVDELLEALACQPALADFADDDVQLLCRQQEAGEIEEDLRHAIETALLVRIQQSQRADRDYWRGIIAELRDLRSQGMLMPTGTAV